MMPPDHESHNSPNRPSMDKQRAPLRTTPSALERMNERQMRAFRNDSAARERNTYANSGMVMRQPVNRSSAMGPPHYTTGDHAAGSRQNRFRYHSMGSHQHAGLNQPPTEPPADPRLSVEAPFDSMADYQSPLSAPSTTIQSQLFKSGINNPQSSPDPRPSVIGSGPASESAAGNTVAPKSPNTTGPNHETGNHSRLHLVEQQSPPAINSIGKPPSPQSHLLFTSFEDAMEGYRDPIFSCPDPYGTIPVRGSEEEKVFVSTLLAALQSHGGSYDRKLTEMMAWRIVAGTRKVHEEGWKEPIDDKTLMAGIMAKETYTFAHRMGLIVELIWRSKSTRDALLRHEYCVVITGAPGLFLKRHNDRNIGCAKNAIQQEGASSLASIPARDESQALSALEKDRQQTATIQSSSPKQKVVLPDLTQPVHPAQKRSHVAYMIDDDVAEETNPNVEGGTEAQRHAPVEGPPKKRGRGRPRKDQSNKEQ